MINSIVLSFCAAGCASLSNLFFRKSSESANSSQTYLLYFYFLSFICSFLLNYEALLVSWNPILLAIGGCAGLLSVALMTLTSRALKVGPSGMTFAFQNVSTLFPNIILFFVFGSAFGFYLAPAQIVGMAFVLVGMFIAAQAKGKVSSNWLRYAIGCFSLQILILTIFQWRCLLFDNFSSAHFLIPVHYADIDDCWFMPGFFGSAFIFQLVQLARQQRVEQISDVLYGSLGGIMNGVSTFCLLLATKWAMPLEKGLIFPIFAVSVIVLCNLWGRKLFGEEINFKANFLCILGIFIALVVHG